MCTRTGSYPPIQWNPQGGNHGSKPPLPPKLPKQPTMEPGDIGSKPPAPAPAPAPRPAPTPAPTPAPAVNNQGGGSSGGNALVEAINDARRERGLRALTFSTRLSEGSRDNNNLSKSRGLGHHIDFAPYGAEGEITAMGSGGLSAKKAVELWLNSPGHRAILLDPSYTQVGADISGNFATADFRH